MIAGIAVATIALLFQLGISVLAAVATQGHGLVVIITTMVAAKTSQSPPLTSL